MEESSDYIKRIEYHKAYYLKKKKMIPNTKIVKKMITINFN